MQPIQAQILHASVDFLPRRLDTPLRLSSGVITESTEARVMVRMAVGKQTASGRGSIYLSHVWAWPGSGLPAERKDVVLRQLCLDYAANLGSLCGDATAHPLELGLRLHRSVAAQSSDAPLLARLMCASPFDAALHDAVGIALGRSAFDLYRRPQPIPSADRLFGREGACRATRQLLRQPVRRLRAWWIIAAGDSLTEVVQPAVQKNGYFNFKLKLLGRDTDEDVRRTSDVYRGLRKIGVEQPALTGDTNEANVDAESVREYLLKLKSDDREAFDALLYLEQPTSRHILEHSFDWWPVTALKPVLLDEGLVDQNRFRVAVNQGWSGFALKTCKGHSFALVAAAWARQQGLRVSLQDLTNPGFAAIHSALFAAHIPMINGVEINSPQYTPSANQEWLPRLNSLFEPSHGYHHLDFGIPPGLGSSL